LSLLNSYIIFNETVQDVISPIHKHYPMKKLTQHHQLRSDDKTLLVELLHVKLIEKEHEVSKKRKV